MEANYHQVVANMKPEVFKIYQEILDLSKHINATRIDMVPGTPEELALFDIEEDIMELLDNINKDPDNWIPVSKQENNGTVTSAIGFIN